MAIIKLGAIVTVIKGSIGGTAFKVQRGTQVMYRKSNGTSRSKLLQNNRLNFARSIFQRWTFLSTTDKNDWNDLATTILFPDKFGVQVNLTGRQLFTKVNINLQGISYYPNPTEFFTTDIPFLEISAAEIDLTAETFTITVDRMTLSDVYIISQFEVLNSPLPAPVFSTRKQIQVELNSGAGTYDIWPEFMAAFPHFSATSNVRGYFTFMSVYGLRSTTDVLLVTVTP